MERGPPHLSAQPDWFHQAMDGTTRLMKPLLGNWTQTWPGLLGSREKGLGVSVIDSKCGEKGDWDLDSGPEEGGLGARILGSGKRGGPVFEDRVPCLVNKNTGHS